MLSLTRILGQRVGVRAAPKADLVVTSVARRRCFLPSDEGITTITAATALTNWTRTTTRTTTIITTSLRWFASGGGPDEGEDDIQNAILTTPIKPIIQTNDVDEADDVDDDLLDTSNKKRLRGKEKKFRKAPVGGGKKVDPDDASAVGIGEEEEEDLLNVRRIGLRKQKKIYFQDPEDDDVVDPATELMALEEDDYSYGLDEDGNRRYGAALDDYLVRAPQVDQATLKAERKEEMDHKKGRGWTDPWDMDEIFASSLTFEDISDWSPKYVSRVSQERIRILDEKIPTLASLATLPLPPSPLPHPAHGHSKAYAWHRTEEFKRIIYDKVAALAAPRLTTIQALSSWEDKQDAVDELFERIEFTLKEQEAILGKHPRFGEWVEGALEQFLRAQEVRRIIDETVDALAKPKVPAIQAMSSPKDKQDAVRELVELIKSNVKEQENSLGRHPRFGAWVDEALEKCLGSIQTASTKSEAQARTDQKLVAEAKEDTEATKSNEDTAIKELSTPAPNDELVFPTKQQDSQASPVFMDCFTADDSEEENIPKILKPLVPLNRGANQGRMMEEWELAAHKTTKRILLRQSTRAMAQFMLKQEAARILVTGRKGAGKTAALLTMVAAARQSGHIVLFMPHTSMLAEHGFYIEPNEHRPGMYDLPVLSEQVCSELHDSHAEDLAAIAVPKEILQIFFSPEQREKSLSSFDSMTVADLLTLGKEKRSLAPMCYSAAIDTLMKQDEKPFTMVVDEFNTLFMPGKYFHEHYDADVRKAIPYNRINLFQPILDAMGLVPSEQIPLPQPVLMKKGAVIAGMSLSKPVGNEINKAIEQSAAKAATKGPTMLVSNILRLSNVEVEHILANYEAIGFGKLRMDQGETVTNAQEVAYLRALSSNVAQELMNACVM